MDVSQEVAENRRLAGMTDEDIAALDAAIVEARAFQREGWKLDLESDFDSYGLGRPAVFFDNDMRYGEHGLVAFDPGVGEHGWYIPSWKDSPTWKTLEDVVTYVEQEDEN
jgi:hypothetical protein